MADKRSGGKRLAIMVSSTVYGVEELLDQVYALLNGFGYEVWMSHKGTVPIYPNETAFDSCLLAAERCDLFLAIITPQYGSGVVNGELGSEVQHSTGCHVVRNGPVQPLRGGRAVPAGAFLRARHGCSERAAGG